MNFKVKNIDQETCEKFFHMSEKELIANNAKRLIVTEPLSAPCRLTLKDCFPGDEIIAFNYFYHDVNSPYRGCGPIFVKVNSKKVFIPENSMPDIVLDQRRFSVRMYDKQAMMLSAEVVFGKDLKSFVAENFMDRKIAYAQVHFAAPGCWVFDLINIF